MPHRESHRVDRIGWLRGAVLGANDGIVSTASLVVGVAATGAGRSQADTEEVDIAREKAELATARAHEPDERTGISVKRGLEPAHGTATAVPCNASADYEDIHGVLSEWSPAG